jgi:hypothetical protein
MNTPKTPKTTHMQSKIDKCRPKSAKTGDETESVRGEK